MWVLGLLVIFLGVALITAVDNYTRGGGRALPGGRPPTLPSVPTTAETTDELPESLVLRLPDPLRTRAWTLLCAVADAQQSAAPVDARTSYLLDQTRQSYLPDTLQAYLQLSEGAKHTLTQQGQPAEVLLTEQLDLMESGVREALRHEHAAADRLLAQGRFLRERFGSADLKLGDPVAPGPPR